MTNFLFVTTAAFVLGGIPPMDSSTAQPEAVDGQVMDRWTPGLRGTPAT